MGVTELYEATAAEWLQRWDRGESVWSVEMGGLGPGYEQCIQITAAEILRHMIAGGYDASRWDTSEAWRSDLEKIEGGVLESGAISKLGLSGAQWGAAVNLAANLYQRGPRVALSDGRVKDRHIQVRRDFP